MDSKRMFLLLMKFRSWDTKPVLEIVYKPAYLEQNHSILLILIKFVYRCQQYVVTEFQFYEPELRYRVIPTLKRSSNL